MFQLVSLKGGGQIDPDVGPELKPERNGITFDDVTRLGHRSLLGSGENRFAEGTRKAYAQNILMPLCARISPATATVSRLVVPCRLVVEV